jgi:hypothetical protein
MTVDAIARAAFERFIVTLPISSIIAQNEPSAAMKQTTCFKQIAVSLEHIGLIEPLVVFEQPGGKFLLIDGHSRLAILKTRGVEKVSCILARDDESYTYNRKVNHVSPITQHFMLLRVLANGVSEQRIADALNIDVRSVRRKRDMLKGICPEVVSLLEGRPLGVKSFSVLRRMKPLRQIEAAEHMIASNNFTLPFLRAILLVTKTDMLTGKDSQGTMPADIAVQHSALEKEHSSLVRDMRAVEQSFGVDMLTLAVSLKYLERVLRNQKVKRYLGDSFPEVFLVLNGLMEEHN